MALIKCPECGKEISDKATVCINCGYPINPPQEETSNNKVKCPKCESTNISTDMRGWSVWTGFFGSGQTVNRCADCGYKWKPKKK